MHPCRPVQIHHACQRFCNPRVFCNRWNSPLLKKAVGWPKNVPSIWHVIDFGFPTTPSLQRGSISGSWLKKLPNLSAFHGLPNRSLATHLSQPHLRTRQFIRATLSTLTEHMEKHHSSFLRIISISRHARPFTHFTSACHIYCRAPLPLVFLTIRSFDFYKPFWCLLFWGVWLDPSQKLAKARATPASWRKLSWLVGCVSYAPYLVEVWVGNYIVWVVN